MIPENGSRSVISEGESCHCGKLHLPFADAATSGAPQATQVVDRWHIIANLGDAVEDFLIRAQIRLEDGKASPQKEQAEDAPLSSFSATPSSQRKSQARLATQMEALSAGAGPACNWDEPAQDWGRTGLGPQYRPQVLSTSTRAASPYTTSVA